MNRREFGFLDEVGGNIRLIGDDHNIKAGFTESSHRAWRVRVELQIGQAPNRVPLAIATLGNDDDAVTIEKHDPPGLCHLAARLSQCADDDARLG